MADIHKSKKGDKDREKKKWRERIREGMRLNQAVVNDRCLRLLRGWQNFIELKGRDPRQAYVRMPRIYSATEQGSADMAKAFTSRKPYFPMITPRHIEDMDRKHQARGITQALQDCYDDWPTERTLRAFFKNTMLYGACIVENQYDFWYDFERTTTEQNAYGIDYRSPDRKSKQVLRQGVRLVSHPIWRFLRPRIGETIRDLDWFIVFQYISRNTLDFIVEEYNIDENIDELIGMTASGYVGQTKLDTELMGWVDAWRSNIKDSAILFRCWENGKEAKYTEYINGEVELRSYPLESSRWPVQLAQYTVEPMDNALIPTGLVDQVEPSFELMDDLLGNHVDVTLAAFDPPTFYDSVIGDTLKNARMSRRARIPIDTTLVSGNKSLSELIHVERPQAPPNITPLLGWLSQASDQAVAPRIGRGEQPPATQKATTTQALVAVDQRIREDRTAMIEMALQFVAEDGSDLIDMWMPYYELERRIGEKLARVVDQMGVSYTSAKSRFRLNAAARMGMNIWLREQLGSIHDRWGELISTRGNPIPLARKDMLLTEGLEPDDVEEILPSEQPPLAPGEVEHQQDPNRMATSSAGAINSEANRQQVSNQRIVEGAA